MSARVGISARNEQIKAIARLVSSGWVQLATGQRPTGDDADAPIPSERVVAEMTLLIDTVTVGVDGVVTCGPVEGRAVRPGVVTWFRLLTPERLTVLDGDVGIGAGDLRLNRVDLLAGDYVTITELTLTAPVRA